MSLVVTREEGAQQAGESWPYRDGGLHLAVFTGVVGSAPQQSELTLFRDEPARELCIPRPQRNRDTQ